MKLDIRKLGNMTQFLSMTVNYEGEQMTICQSDYIWSRLKDFHLENAVGRSAPLEINRDDGMESGDEPYDVEKYRKAVGKLLYLAVTTRPDIAFAVFKASKKNVKPTKRDWQDVKHIMLYLKQTVDVKLTFKKDDDNLIVYSDSDFANGPDRKSVCGFVSILSGAPVSWNAKSGVSNSRPLGPRAWLRHAGPGVRARLGWLCPHPDSGVSPTLTPLRARFHPPAPLSTC